MQRKKPFSHKQKKAQLAEKRARKRGELVVPSDDGKPQAALDVEEEQHQEHRRAAPLKKFVRARETGIETLGDNVSQHRLVSVFAKEPPELLQKRKEEAMKEFKRLPSKSLEVSLQDIYPPESVIEMPKRPAWTVGESKEVVEKREEEYFKQWMANVYEKYPLEELSFFEHNLEVWRQLWRVCEISDIILLIVDIRHPILHFPPSLYTYVTQTMKRQFVLVFNKIDLVTSETVEAWSNYFKQKFPGIHTAALSSYPKEAFVTSEVDERSSAPEQNKQRRKGVSQRKKLRRYLHAVGVTDVLKAVQDLKIKKEGVLVDWQTLIKEYDRDIIEIAPEQTRQKTAEEELEESQGRRNRWKIIKEREEREEKVKRNSKSQNEEDNETTDSEEGEQVEELQDQFKEFNVQDMEHQPHEKLVTIGLIGHPNVGKSSLINSILGRKVVSTSRTPGHTKHFQTIHLTQNVRLCDCPGLVFPSLLPKPLQILSGMYKIAQVQDPYSSVQYLAERVPVERVLNLIHPDEYEEHGGIPRQGTNSKAHHGEKRGWSAWEICESFAIQRGFLTAKAARPDVYRAANYLLRLTNDGKILLSFKPPGFFAKYGDKRESSMQVLEERDREEESEQSDREGSESGSETNSGDQGDNGMGYIELGEEEA